MSGAAEAPGPRARLGEPVAGILLAAGASSRMGANKLLLELGGESLLARAARRSLEAGLAPLVVVLGHEAERARRELAGLACHVVVNSNYLEGMTTSLAVGLRALLPEVPAVSVVLADMPYVTAEMIAALAARYRSSRARLVLSDYQGVTAPPFLYDRSLFPELLAMAGGRCGQRVIQQHRQEAEVLSWPASALIDLDRPEDYQRASREAVEALSAEVMPP